MIAEMKASDLVAPMACIASKAPISTVSISSQVSLPIYAKENTAIAHEAAIASLGFNPQDYKVGSKEFKQKTNDLGVATLDANLDKGTYTVTVVNPLTGETKNSNMIITKSTPSLSLSLVKENGADVLKAILPKTDDQLIFAL